MKKIYSVLVFCAICTFSFGQITLPAPFSLASGNYSFTAWDSASAAGTYPANMRFYFTTQPESATNSKYDSSAEASANYTCRYDLTSRNRILGLEANGFSFQATSSAQYNDCSGAVTTADSDRYVGVAELGLNTTGKTNIGVKWKGTIIILGDGNGDTTMRRQYTVRLQYRIGAAGKYINVLDGINTDEWNSIGKVNGASGILSTTLPSACNNQPVVYLRWVYFQEVLGSGTRPQIAVDDISVGANILPVNLVTFNVINNNGNASLSWKTENEINFSRFDVEKSADAVHFNAISTVTAIGKPGSHEYSYSDDKIFTGNNYYRLKMIDNDGKYNYSGILLYTSTISKSLVVYPNPVANNLVLMHPKAGSNGLITIFSYDGKKLGVYPVQENAVQTSVNVSRLTTGNYLVIFSDTKQKLNAKFSKQ